MKHNDVRLAAMIRQFESLPESYSKPYDRRYFAARGCVQEMQREGILPKNMSDSRFTEVGLWVMAAMEAAVKDC